MGYRGKLAEQEEARRLRAQSWTLLDIAGWLGVAKGSVSTWVRDVEFEPSPRRTGAQRRPHPFRERKLAEIERLNAEGIARVGELSEREFLMAGIALYAGEGGKTDGEISFPNMDPRMIDLFCRWLRHFFDIDESRLRVRLYLHEGLDVEAAIEFWSQLTAIPRSQFGKPYRAEANPTIRKAKHPRGCPSIRYTSVTTHRAVMGLVTALLTCEVSNPG
jgi:hypothetical protein